MVMKTIPTQSPEQQHGMPQYLAPPMQSVLCLPQPRWAIGKLDEHHVARCSKVESLTSSGDGNEQNSAMFVSIELVESASPVGSMYQAIIVRCNDIDSSPSSHVLLHDARCPARLTSGSSDGVTGNMRGKKKTCELKP